MSLYENKLIAKQDLPKTEITKIKEKYNDIINNNSGKVIVEYKNLEQFELVSNLLKKNES